LECQEQLDAKVSTCSCIGLVEKDKRSASLNEANKEENGEETEMWAEEERICRL
jgi:hypothetical protein